MDIKYIPLALVDDYEQNSNLHPEAQLAQIERLILNVGWTVPALVRQRGERYELLAGHGRKHVAVRMFERGAQIKTASGELVPTDCLPVILANGWTDDQVRAYVIADNAVGRNAETDEDVLARELALLQAADFDLDFVALDDDYMSELIDAVSEDDLAYLSDEDEDAPDEAEAGEGEPESDPRQVVKLADSFLIPPFSVLNAREGWWANRKRQWVSLGIKSEAGRGDTEGADSGLAFSVSSQPPAVYDKKEAYEKSVGKPLTWPEFYAARPQDFQVSGTSIFDPVLCELAYRWFSPVGGTVLDCFAGGSVRGIVAAKLGRHYVGQDLRAEQVDANRLQAAAICTDEEPMPVWKVGDSRQIHQHCAEVSADFVFSCPPYADLEVYSDDPQDLSTLDYPAFKAAYFEIIAHTCRLLKPNAFACFVVGDVRDKQGHYYNFVGDTVEAFKAAGLQFYNEAILVTQSGSLAIRARRPFELARKLGKTHQNILVFVKGDAKKAAERCGDVDVSDVFNALVPDSTEAPDDTPEDTPPPTDATEPAAAYGEVMA